MLVIISLEVSVSFAENDDDVISIASNFVAV